MAIGARDTPTSGRRGPSARYVAIIADGNARWAMRRGLPVAAGHAAAADTLKARVRDALAIGVQELSVYVFSTENWSRPAGEVRTLMTMFAHRISAETPALHRDGIKVRFIGGRDGIPPALLASMCRLEALTTANERLRLFIAFNYGGRAEIVAAARCFDGGGEREFGAALYAPEMHDPDVIIRTGGERRLSNYLLWQSAYAELVFCDELWPDFTGDAFEQCLQDFSKRRRRFGGRAG
jgi:undecaprenyl diphosphate synthase